VLKSYWLTSVKGDHYAKEWPIEQFARFGIKYKATDNFKSDIYLATLPLINSTSIRLLDNTRMINQLLDLDRSSSRGGKESIGYPDGAHDDLCNAACGALLECTVKRPRIYVGTYVPCLMAGAPADAGYVKWRDNDDDRPHITIRNITEREALRLKEQSGGHL
jgi:hypothetical protein